MTLRPALMRGLFTAAAALGALALACCAPLSLAADAPFRAATTSDFTGIWKQVDVTALDPKVEIRAGFYSGEPQYFWLFPDGGFKHLRLTQGVLTEQTLAVWKAAPVVQKVEWGKQGRALLKHPERPPEPLEVVYFLQDSKVPAAGLQGRVPPQKGDLLLIFYHYDRPAPAYYRMLRLVRMP